jgi:hypothetical protein
VHHGLDASQKRLSVLVQRGLPLGTTFDHNLDARENVVHAMFEFAHEKSSIRLLPLMLRDVAQQNREDALSAHFQLADRTFRRKFVAILMQGKNSLSFTHVPSGIRRRAEFANVIGVGSPKPLGQ